MKKIKLLKRNISKIELKNNTELTNKILYNKQTLKLFYYLCLIKFIQIKYQN